MHVLPSRSKSARLLHQSLSQPALVLSDHLMLLVWFETGLRHQPTWYCILSSLTLASTSALLTDFIPASRIISANLALADCPLEVNEDGEGGAFFGVVLAFFGGN